MSEASDSVEDAYEWLGFDNDDRFWDTLEDNWHNPPPDSRFVQDLSVVGVTFRDGYPGNLLRLDSRIGEDISHGTATLEREPTNPYDPNAVKVVVGGEHIGYVPKEKAVALSAALLEGVKYVAFVKVQISPEHKDRPGVVLFIDYLGDRP